MRKPSPVIVLFLLAPAVGELLSGSSPPVEFFNPFGFMLMSLLYGCGAIVVRELKVRWRKGLISVLLLGAAYGVLEEGVMVASFFNSAWPDLGSMVVYGRWWEVNWIWAEMLTIYHAVFSIAIPIVLVELAYPEKKVEQWVRKKGFVVVAGLLAFDVIFGFLLINTMFNYTPPFAQYSLALVVMCMFGYLAYKFPSARFGGKEPLPKPLKLWAIGVPATFVFFLWFYSMPAWMPSWSLGMLFGPLLILVYWKILGRYDWTGNTRKHLFALSSGALTWFIMFAPLQELDATRTDNRSGMFLVGISFLITLVLFKRYVWKTEKTSESTQSSVKIRVKRSFDQCPFCM